MPQKTTLVNDFVWCGSDGKVYVYVYGRRKGSKNSMENLRGRGMYLGAHRTDVLGLCSIGIRWQESTLVVFLLDNGALACSSFTMVSVGF